MPDWGGRRVGAAPSILLSPSQFFDRPALSEEVLKHLLLVVTPALLPRIGVDVVDLGCAHQAMRLGRSSRVRRRQATKFARSLAEYRSWVSVICIADCGGTVSGPSLCDGLH